MNRKERTVLVATLVNALLVLFKLWLADASGSLALRASALHSGADVAIGVFVLIGLVLGRREAAGDSVSARLSVVENAVALVVAAAIFYVGFDIVREVLMAEPPELSNLGVVTLAALLTVGVAWVLARYKLYVGRATESPALIASGYHSRMDIYASMVVVAGLAGAALGIPNLDAAAAAIVVVLIFLSGYQIAAAALAALRERRLVDMEAGDAEIARDAPGWRHRGLAIAAGLAALYAASGLYVVAPGETAVVRRFGEIVRGDIGPGLHLRWPWPIGQADIVATAAVERIGLEPVLVFTGDDNLVSVSAAVHYRIADAPAFLIAAADPRRLTARAAEAAVRRVVGIERVDALLTTDKAAIEGRASALIQETLDDARAGVRITDVQLLRSDPPPAVAGAFRDVASAREDRNTFINEAIAYANEVLPEARGEAARRVESAKSYAARKVALSSGEATAFSARQGAYAAAPTITRERLYLEAVERVLAGTRKFIVDPSVSLQTTDLWIQGTEGAAAFPPKP